MSVFISYKTEDCERVRHLIEALRQLGLSVWWDRDITPDAPWEETIESELERAKVVIVAWSKAAVASENVKAEARRARRHGKLIQVFIEPCEPPLFFGERQGVDLSSWRGDASDQRFVAILDAARALLAGKRPPQGVGYAPRRRTPWRVLAAVCVGLSASLSFVSNVGGARDTVCSVAAVTEFCRRFIPPYAPTTERTIAAERATLLARLPGSWGLAGRPAEPSCSRAFRLNVERRGGDDVVVLTDGDYVSAMRVVTAIEGVINLRALPPAEKIGEPSELSPEADRLTWQYADGRSAAYVRCAD